MRRRAVRSRWRRSSRKTACRPAASRPTDSRVCKKRMIAAGQMSRLRLAGLKPERVPVLPGGLAIMAAALQELDVPRINPVGGALRLGVLYDLLGRTISRDSRVATVDSFMERYRIDRPHALRVAAMAKALYLQASPRPDAETARRVEWAAELARNRLLGLAHRLPSARRLHPRERRHAGFLGAGTAPAGDTRTGLSRRAVEDGRRARRCRHCGAGAGAAAGGAVPPRATGHRDTRWCA